MKRTFIGTVAFLFAATLMPSRLHAQQIVAQEKSQIPRYRLVDLGTFGGPNSAETVEFPYVNSRGMVVGFADTDIPDPFNPGGFLPHAFRWKHGVLSDLGTLPGGQDSFAIWSNDRGEVVGLSDNGRIDPVLGGPQGRGVLWDRHGHIVNLGTLGGTQSLAGNINQRGQIVGVAANKIPDPNSVFGWATQTRAVLWQEGKVHDLGTLGGTDATAVAINDRGQIAGFSYTSSDPSTACFPLDIPVSLATGAFLWERGKMLNLGGFGGTCTFPVVINNRGQIAGQSNLAGDETAHPFLWHQGVMKDLGTLGGTFGAATWLNDVGDVAGLASTMNDEETHAFFWRNGVMSDLGTIKGDPCSIAHFMNSKGQVVGTSGCTSEEFEVHGFLWQPGGSIIDLNDFVPSGSNLRVTDGETINDRGEIAGSGELPNGDFHAIVLIPCDDAHGGDTEGCQDADQNATSIESASGVLSAASPTRPKVNPRAWVGAFGARSTHRYPIPGLGPAKK